MKAVLAKAAASALVLCGIMAVGLLHYNASVSRISVSPAVRQMWVEPHYSGEASTVLRLGQTELNILREDLPMPLARARTQIIARARSKGWAPVDIDLAQTDFPFRSARFETTLYSVFTTPDNRMVVHVFDGAAGATGSTCVTTCELDLDKLMRDATRGGGQLTVDVPDRFRSVMVGKTAASYGGRGGEGSQIFVCQLGAMGLDAALEEVSARLVRDGWKLETWTSQLYGKLDTEGEFRDKRFVSALKDDQLCHVVVGGHAGEMLATYRFSNCRVPVVQR